MKQHDPYQAPAAELESAVPLQSRPPEVLYACLCFGLSILLGAIGAVADRELGNPEMKLIVVAMLLAVAAAVCLTLYFRQNWARWIFSVLIVLGLIAAPMKVASMHGSMDAALYLTQAVLQAAAVYLLFRPHSSRWYKRA